MMRACELALQWVEPAILIHAARQGIKRVLRQGPAVMCCDDSASQTECGRKEIGRRINQWHQRVRSYFGKFAALYVDLSEALEVLQLCRPVSGRSLARNTRELTAAARHAETRMNKTMSMEEANIDVNSAFSVQSA